LRRDIQFLRGIAVLVVVLYHSNLGLLKQGYLGVDVFFVLSGFLITSIILKDLDCNNFQFSEFYLRRAKRLLPALYSTLFFTTLLSLIILTNQQWSEYLDQLKGALTFTANMVLPSQTGYFESASEGKPLLHIWSLSLEEQYYFLLPISLYFLPKKLRFTSIIIFAFISLYWCFSWVYADNQYTPFLWRIADATKSEWAFYLLFTRAWELLAGSICAWVMLNNPSIKIHKLFKLIALVTICLICSININNEHPSIESFIIVISTMLILVGNTDWLPKNLMIRLIEKIGDWSYSIYLIHWPLFAFAYLSYVGEVPSNVKFMLIICSLVLGYIQFRYVETPFRLGKFKSLFSNWKITISATVILLAIPMASAYTVSKVDDEFSHIRRVNHGLNKDCEGSFNKDLTLKSNCLLGMKPKIAVWGDSYAMHLVPGLSVGNKGIVQLTKSVCGPILGISPINSKYGTVWAKTCLQFNKNVQNYIQRNPSITHVILSSTLGTYLNFDDGEYLTDEGTVKATEKLLLGSLKNTISELRKLNITPIVISPPPKTGFDVGECLERQYGSALLLRNNCEIDYAQYIQHQSEVNKVLSELEKVTKVVWLKDYLCSNKTCKVAIDNVFLYRDKGHLSIDGSIKLFSDFKVSQFD
jgi:peptidoglycan/LPS O-acetylase OafA/YrhL